MDNNQDVIAINKLLYLWVSDIDQMKHPDVLKAYEKKSFIAKIIRGKLKKFHVSVNVPSYLIAIVEECTHANPGMSQVLLKHMMQNIEGMKRGYTIIPEDFARVFCNEIPSVRDPKWGKTIEDLWDKQKDENGNNLCDTPEWWNEIFAK